MLSKDVKNHYCTILDSANQEYYFWIHYIKVTQNASHT